MIAARRWPKVHLPQLIVLPFVVVNSARPPDFVSAQPRAADDFQQPALSAKRPHIFVFGELISAGFDGPAVKNSWKIGAAISRINNRSRRATGAATHHCDGEVTCEVDAFFMKLLANTCAKHARQPVTAQIQRRGLTGVDVRRIALKARLIRFLLAKAHLKGRDPNECNDEMSPSSFHEYQKIRAVLCASVRPLCLDGEMILGTLTTEARRSHRATEGHPLNVEFFHLVYFNAAGRR